MILSIINTNHINALLELIGGGFSCKSIKYTVLSFMLPGRGMKVVYVYNPAL